jgi:phosphoenolpyruvate carboxykinase (GTP)
MPFYSAIAGKVGELRRDPMAMLAFCGYNMGDYFAHYLKIGERSSKLPKIFYVNWFRQDENGKFLWPGYGENSRVLKWVFERCDGKVHATETPIGRLPDPADLDVKGLDLSPATLAKLLNVDVQGWLDEVPRIKGHFAKFGDRLPKGLDDELAGLEQRLKAAKK